MVPMSSNSLSPVEKPRSIGVMQINVSGAGNAAKKDSAEPKPSGKRALSKKGPKLNPEADSEIKRLLAKKDVLNEANVY